MNIRTLAFTLVLLLLNGALHAASPAAVTHEKDIVYARKYGLALTVDVMQPAKPNGRGILAMISGGWRSSNAPVNPANYAEYLEHGYTVFAVRHGSQPKFIVSEIVQDIHRAVRFVRHNAARWNVHPDRLGITGSSAGGHLSLTIGTKGGPGDPKAKDPVDRESSAVQAVACFYPPTDFLNYGAKGSDGTGTGTLKNYQKAFGPKSETPEGRQELGRELSPIYYITAKMPPTFIVHGDADKLVPLQQSEIFVQRAAELGAKVKLHIKAGAGHGWKNKGPDYALMADWFDKYLLD